MLELLMKMITFHQNLTGYIKIIKLVLPELGTANSTAKKDSFLIWYRKSIKMRIGIYIYI